MLDSFRLIACYLCVSDAIRSMLDMGGLLKRQLWYWGMLMNLLFRVVADVLVGSSGRQALSVAVLDCSNG